MVHRASRRTRTWFGSGNALWVESMGARKVCTLPMAMLADKEVGGELWFMRGERAYGGIEWETLDVGERMAEEAVKERLNTGCCSTDVWRTSGSKFVWARGEGVRQVGECCDRAAVPDSTKVAEQIARISMDLMWGIERVFEREVWNRRSAQEDTEEVGSGEAGVDGGAGKDATRGAYMDAYVYVERGTMEAVAKGTAGS